MRKLIVIVLASILCTSCDTFLNLSVDSANKLPIDSVCIYVGKQKENCIYTDSLGRFKISQMAVGGFFGYPGINISLEKKGYKNLKKKYANWNEKPVVINMSKE